MAFQAGKNAYLSIDGTDVSAYTDNESLNRVIDQLETTTFGDDDKTFITGLRSFDLSSSGPWDPTFDGVIDGADDGASVAWVFGPEGNDSGDQQYSGNANLASYGITNAVSGRTEYSLSFQPTGAVTRGTA